MEAQLGWKGRALAYYEKHELRLSLAFFLGGFVFDVLTLSDIDDPISIAQQVAYIAIMGFILCYDFVNGEEAELQRGPGFVRRFWAYRMLVLHFFLGSLLSIYSLFFLKSASFFSSVVFVLFLLGMMVGNELKSVQKSGLDFKIALYVICVFCFFSMVIPILLGFVGMLPFLLSLVATAAFVWAMYKTLEGRVGSIILRRRLLAPGAIVALAFSAFYLIGWIPPVPLSATKMGVYHRVEKPPGDTYHLYHERPWWKFWRSGDQDFRAEPGDKIFFFVSVFSPARFDDSVYLRWSQHHPKLGWQGTDRIPMRIVGGRKGGYRGFTTKSNFSPGDWRVSVETSDSREIGRMYFTVEAAEPGSVPREFKIEEY
jgi:hypothetical protein